MKKTTARLTHLDSAGAARMVDIGEKPVQARRAVAGGRLTCRRASIRLLRDRGLPKGDVLAVARIAGIQAAKRTSELIPLCHPLALNQVQVDFIVGADHIGIRAEVSTRDRTGAEMEALTAVAVAALSLYDTMKAVDKTMRIEGIEVLEKEKR